MTLERVYIDDLPDILHINGIMISAKARYGDLSEIRYRALSGENAKCYIEKSLRSFLNDKKYLDEMKPKSEYDNIFRGFSLLLLVNCSFSKPLKIEEYEHLIYNFPKLSKYLVTKLMVDMKLVEHFCTVLEKKLPLSYSCEIFSEFIPALDKVEFDQLLKYCHCILQTIANISLENQEFKYSDDMDLLLRHVPDFFEKITRLSTDEATEMKKNSVYQRVGRILEKLFSLLFFCHENNMLEGIFIDKLIFSTTSIVKAVTLDMFLYWVEMDSPSGDDNLQSHLAESAYLIIEKYQPHKPASEMVLALKPFATKPKDIKEQIQSASMEKMVIMINRADENQKKWFQALIFSSYISNKMAIKCVFKWKELCDEEDVSRLLNQSLIAKDAGLKELAVMCAFSLNFEQMLVVVIRHFYNNGLVVLDDNNQEMVLWSNRLKESESNETDRELLWFILKNPEFSVNFLLTECIKSEFHITSLHSSIVKLKDIWKIHDMCLIHLTKLFETTPPSAETSQAYKKLIQTFFDINLMTFEVFSGKILCPLLEGYLKTNDYEKMKQLLVILNNLELKVLLADGTMKFFDILFEMLSRRTDFRSYNSGVQNVVQEVVHFILNKTTSNLPLGPSHFPKCGESRINNYYKHYLLRPFDRTTFSEYMIGDCTNVDNCAFLSRFVETLTSCVQDEWLTFCSEISERTGFRRLIRLIRDMIIFECTIARSEKFKGQFRQYLEGLISTIHNFGHTLKTKFLPLDDEENEIILTQALVVIISCLPDIMKEREGLNMINSLMTVSSLKALGNDSEFVNNICNIKNTKVCQLIATKILQ